MKDETKIGVNYTGIHMSPLDSVDLIYITEKTTPDVKGGLEDLTKAREEFIEESECIGSVPIPGTLRGAVNKALDALTNNNMVMYLDKLGERIAFERTGARLYDALIAKMDTVYGSNKAIMDTLRQFHNEEIEHFKIAVTALEELGGDATALTPCADVSSVASEGVLKVITDPSTNIMQSLQAMLIAEMTDTASWELLIKLAHQVNQVDFIDQFERAFEEEKIHTQTIKQWLENKVLKKAL